jgi:hypothetical protein
VGLPAQVARFSAAEYLAWELRRASAQEWRLWDTRERDELRLESIDLSVALTEVFENVPLARGP